MIKMVTRINLKRPIAIHLLIIAMFISYLFSANYLFGKVFTVYGEAGKVKLPSISKNEQVFLYFDEVKETKIKWKQMVTIVGWSFIEGVSTNKDNEIFVVLTSKKNQYAFNTDVVIREDVTRYFKDLKLNLDYSGFSSNIAKEVIPDDTYKIGLFIKNNNKMALTYSNNVLVKKDGKIKFGLEEKPTNQI